MKVSSPERAILEVLYKVENGGVGFQHAMNYLKGLLR